MIENLKKLKQHIHLKVLSIARIEPRFYYFMLTFA